MRDQFIVPRVFDRLFRKIESIAVLTEADRQAISALPITTRLIPADQDITREGDHPNHCCLVVEGFVYRYKMLQDGKRQILSFHVPGDIPDLQSLHLGTMDHSLGAIVSSEVAFIPHAAVHDLVSKNPNVASAFWRDTLIDASIFREWIANVGSRSASQRIAHLLCELYLRFRVVNMADDSGFNLPLTQAEIGDTTGLSTVHVNRTLQELRGKGLIASHGRFLHILNWRGLQETGGFDPGYLHMNDPVR